MTSALEMRIIDGQGAEVEYGPTAWVLADQDRIDAFAKATGDNQWLHVDIARAKEGAFGATIAHGYLTLALFNIFIAKMFTLPDGMTGKIDAVENLRFLSPVLVNSRVRAHGKVQQVAQSDSDDIRAILRIRIEIEGASRPACEADVIFSISKRNSRDDQDG